MSARGFAHARDDGVAGVAHLTRLIATDAGTNGVGGVRRHLRRQIGVGDLGPRHLDAVAHTVGQRPLGLADVDDGALQEHCGGRRHGRAHRATHVDVETGRLVEVGAGLLHRENRAPDDHHVVQPDARQFGRDARRHFGGDAGPWRQLVARQAHTDDGVRTRRVANRRDHPTGERQSVGPLVTAMVRETRHELANEAVLSGVDFHTVATGRDGDASGIGETGDDGGDVLGFHPFGYFATVDLGNA